MVRVKIYFDSQVKEMKEKLENSSKFEEGISKHHWELQTLRTVPQCNNLKYWKYPLWKWHYILKWHFQGHQKQSHFTKVVVNEPENPKDYVPDKDEEKTITANKRPGNEVDYKFEGFMVGDLPREVVSDLNDLVYLNW